MPFKPCPCGSGHSRSELHDAAGIFCAFICDACEGEKRARYRQEIFNPSSPYAASGEIGKYPPKALKKVLENVEWLSPAIERSLFRAAETCFGYEGYICYPQETHPDLTLKPSGASPELIAAMEVKNVQIRELQDEIPRQAILALFPDRDPDDLEISTDGWFCDGSPTQTCVYDYRHDGECCIICGNPEERK